MCKRLINTFQAQDAYFNFKGKVKVVYPANVVSGKPYANGVTRSVYMHATPNNDQWWKVRRPIAFHGGFAEFASWELLHELWGDEPDSTLDKKLPFTRYALVHDLHLDTVDEVEQSDVGVFRALCLLTGRAIYARRFGDKNTRLDTNPYAEKVETKGLDCPENPRLTTGSTIRPRI